MSRFIETIKIENRIAHTIEGHSKRLNETRRAFFGKVGVINLQAFIRNEIEIKDDAVYKLSVSYSEKIQDFKINKYTIPEIHSLKIIEDNSIDYSYKYSDRSGLEALFQKRGECDDIIIIKNGFVTDSYFANLAVWNGEKWYTPSRPLLKGTKRKSLIEKGTIHELDIRKGDLLKFQKFCLINAMLDLGDIEIKAENIVF